MSLTAVLRDLVNDWRPKSETFFMRWSTLGMTALSCASACYITRYYRGFMMLKYHALFGTYMPSLILGVPVSGAFRDYYVYKDLLEFNSKSALNYNLKLASGQVGFGILLPMFTSTLSTFYYAERRLTYKLPALTADPAFWVKTFLRGTRPILGRLALLVAVNVTASFLLSHLEARQLVNVLNVVYDHKVALEASDGDQNSDPYGFVIE